MDKPIRPDFVEPDRLIARLAKGARARPADLTRGAIQLCCDTLLPERLADLDDKGWCFRVFSRVLLVSGDWERRVQSVRYYVDVGDDPTRQVYVRLACGVGPVP